MESIYVKQRTAKYSFFFPAQDGNISTLEEERFPYSMNMDFGPALNNDSFDLDAALTVQRHRVQTLEQQRAAEAVRQALQPGPPGSQAQQDQGGLGHERRSSLSPTTSDTSLEHHSPSSPRPSVEDIAAVDITGEGPLGSSKKRQTPAAPGPQDHGAGDLFTDTYLDPSPLPEGVTTRRQAAPLKLTKDQYDFLLQLITQLNTFKEQSISAKWLVPLVTFTSSRQFVLHEEAATPANLEVVTKLMTIEDKGLKLTAMTTQALQKWMTRNHLRFKGIPESPPLT
jgi:hypothetical protein